MVATSPCQVAGQSQCRLRRKPGNAVTRVKDFSNTRETIYFE